MAGADVIVNIRFDRDSIEALGRLLPDAISRALDRARARIMEFAEKYTPVRTGRLLSSFDMAFTPATLAMKWDAVDPRSGYHYAKVVDVGRHDRNPFPGRFYSEAVKWEAKAAIREELLRELALMSLGGGGLIL